MKAHNPMDINQYNFKININPSHKNPIKLYFVLQTSQQVFNPVLIERCKLFNNQPYVCISICKTSQYETLLLEVIESAR